MHSLNMIRGLRNNTELKYIGVIIILTTILQLVTTAAIWKDILVVAQVIFVEIFLILSFQVLSLELNRRILELKRLCNLTHAANMRLIKDVVSLKGLMRKSQGTHPETCFENTNRVVMEALKNKTPAKRGRKMISQRNKRNRMKPYVVQNVNSIPRPVETKVQDPSYVHMDAGAARAQLHQDRHLLRERSPVRKAESPKSIRGKNEFLVKAENTKQKLDNEHKQAFENCVREQQYFCTRKNVKGRNIYERLCLNCSAVMKQVGHPIYSKICQNCKPVHGQNITHYKRLTKFNNLIEFYCGCRKCFTTDDPPCLLEYCGLCTIPKFTRKVSEELKPILDDE